MRQPSENTKDNDDDSFGVTYEMRSIRWIESENGGGEIAPLTIYTVREVSVLQLIFTPV